MTVLARSLRAFTLALGLAALAACTSVDLKEPAKIEKRDGSSGAGGSGDLNASTGVSGIARPQHHRVTRRRLHCERRAPGTGAEQRDVHRRPIVRRL